MAQMWFWLPKIYYSCFYAVIALLATEGIHLYPIGREYHCSGKRSIEGLAMHGASLAIYLSASDPEGMVKELLTGGYPGDTPVILAYRVGWPDEIILSTRLTDLCETEKDRDIHRQALFLVLPGQKDSAAFSRLYDPEFTHTFRKRKE